MVSTKPFQNYEDLLTLLGERGMRIADLASAEESLRNIGYYRLSGYWYPFREPFPNQQKLHGYELTRKNEFREGTNFDDIIRLMRFDTRLRKAVASLSVV